MKKMLFLFIFVLFFAFSMSVHAEKFDNNAFIGQWLSSDATNTDYAELDIGYMDSCIINTQLTIVKNGGQEWAYTVYQGNVKNDNTVELKFDAYQTDSIGNTITKTGYIQLSFYVDNIWLSVYSDDGEDMYNGMLKNNFDGFNPYNSPINYNVNISLNSNILDLIKKPLIINGTTYVPLRGTLDSMNMNVYWDEFDYNATHIQMITSTKGSDILEMKRVNSGKGNTGWKMKKWTADAPDTIGNNVTDIDMFCAQPIIIDNSSYIPLRVVAENFGADVQWNDSIKTVMITYDVECDTKKSSEEISALEDFSPKSASDMVSRYYTALSCRNYPYYTRDTKYFVFDCIRNGMKLVAKVDNNGNTLEYTVNEWNELQ